MANTINIPRTHLIMGLCLPLAVLLGYFLAEPMESGGIGLKALGSSRYGGKGYFYVFAGIAGYFALTSQRVPARRVGLFLAMFFLPAISSLIANLAYAGGPAFYFVFELFPAGLVQEQ